MELINEVQHLETQFEVLATVMGTGIRNIPTKNDGMSVSHLQVLDFSAKNALEEERKK